MEDKNTQTPDEATQFTPAQRKIIYMATFAVGVVNHCRGSRGGCGERSRVDSRADRRAWLRWCHGIRRVRVEIPRPMIRVLTPHSQPPNPNH